MVAGGRFQSAPAVSVTAESGLREALQPTRANAWRWDPVPLGLVQDGDKKISGLWSSWPFVTEAIGAGDGG